MTNPPISNFRYVQVLTSITTEGLVVQLIGTTTSEDKQDGLDILLLRHRLQLQEEGMTVASTSVTYMASDGKMSHEKLRQGINPSN